MKTQKFPYPWNMRLPVTSRVDARRVLAAWSLTLGVGFHPDTKGEDYVETNRTKKTFTPAQASVYNSSIEQCRAALNAGNDFYEVCLAIHTEIHGL